VNRLRRQNLHLAEAVQDACDVPRGHHRNPLIKTENNLLQQARPCGMFQWLLLAHEVKHPPHIYWTPFTAFSEKLLEGTYNNAIACTYRIAAFGYAK
jgi:hypothetical protein